jgi:hypothetical protein
LLSKRREGDGYTSEGDQVLGSVCRKERKLALSCIDTLMRLIPYDKDTATLKNILKINALKFNPCPVYVETTLAFGVRL